jgi:hypothetical protein
MLYFDYTGIASGKYVTGEIIALNQEEAAFKLKSNKIIITLKYKNRLHKICQRNWFKVR